MHALLDADRLAYSCGGAKDDDGYPLEWPLVASRIDSNIESTLQSVGATSRTLFLTANDKSNFRIRVATIRPYKGHRSAEKPFWYEQVRRYLVDTYQARLVSGMEADDAMGIAQYTAEWSQLEPGNTIICSADKDLNNIPGWHYDELSKKTHFVSETESLQNFYCQLLTGDSTDHILGLFGVGRSSKLCSHIHKMVDELDMYSHVRKQYEKRFGSYWRLFLTENAMLLWIKRQDSPHQHIEIQQRLEGLESLRGKSSEVLELEVDSKIELSNN